MELHCILCRELDEDYHWMHCTLKIDADIIGKEQAIAYKYIVLWNDECYFEFFHDARKSNGMFNRCLQVTSKFKGLTY